MTDESKIMNVKTATERWTTKVAAEVLP